MKEDPSRRFAREGWNGKGIFIQLQVPDEGSKMTHPYIYIDTTGLQSDNPDAPRDLVPWFASQTDMLAEDWYEAGGMSCPKCGSLVTPQLGCTVANSSIVWTELVCPICGAYMGRI